MTPIVKTWSTGLILVLMLMGASTTAWGFGPGGGGGLAMGGESRGLTIISGRVLCSQCDMEELRVTQPTLSEYSTA